MARRVLVQVESPMETSGTLRAVVTAGSVRRMDATVADSPSSPETSPPIVIDTRQQIDAVWDIPDSLVFAGDQVEIGLEFNQDVRLPDGRGLEEDPEAWLRVQGVEIPFDSIAIIPQRDEDEEFALRLANTPFERVPLNTEFTITVRTTLNRKLTAAPTTSAISLSTGTVDSVCTVICNESYSFSCTSPNSGRGTITVTAVASGWSVITTDLELGTVEYGTLTTAPTLTIGSGSLSGTTLTFTATWSEDVGTGQFCPNDITIQTSSSSVSARVDSVTPVTSGVNTEFNVSCTIAEMIATGQSEDVNFVALVQAGAIPATATRSESAGTRGELGSFTIMG